MIREEIVDAIQRATTEVLYSDDLVKKFKGTGVDIVDKVNLDEIELDFTGDGKFGDYTTNFSMRAFRKFAESAKSHVGEIAWARQSSGWKNPYDLAIAIVKELEHQGGINKICDSYQAVQPGFINFWLKRDVLVNNLIEIDNGKGKYGSSDLGNGKTVVIDYSSPNIAKPFGIGHLRSTIIGQALYNLYKFLGYEVVGDNHLGDWGTQFGKLLYMLKDFSEEEIGKLAIRNLERLYVEFHKRFEADPKLEDEARAWFKKLEDGDIKAKKLWKLCVDISLNEFEKVYKLLGVKIDFAFGESYYIEGEMKGLMNDKEVTRRLSVGEDGAKIINLEKFGINTPLMFLKKDGATTYATRDLATIAFRVRKWDPDIIIYEVGNEQALYFQQLFASARLLGLIKKDIKFVHTAHGLYLDTDGKKFSTRKGKTIRLEEVLDEAIQRAKKLGNKDEKVAKEVGIGAIKYYDLMHSVQSNVVFDWEKMMNLEGNSGPYLQYTVARAGSVIEKSKKERKIEGTNPNQEELVVLRALSRFSEIIEDSAKNYSPNTLCNYLYDLAQKFNSFYNKHKIIEGENEEFRVLLTKGVWQVLKNGLNLLGIETPQKM